MQWTFWATNEIDPLLILMMGQFLVKPEIEQEQKKAALKALQRPTQVLDDHLADRDYLLGDTFSIADLNVAGVMYPGPASGYDLTTFPSVAVWFERCVSREASQRILKIAFEEFQARNAQQTE